MASRFDPQPPDRGSAVGGGSGRSASRGVDLTYAHLAQPPLDLNGHPVDLLALIGRAEDISREYMGRTIEEPLSQAYRAWQGLHPTGSKYLSPSWAGRSKLHVPKTRTAVRKNMAAAAAALFATDDVVNISAEFEDDPIQRAVAATIKGALDYRLTRQSAKTGVPWFLIAMGACLDGQITGVAVSKQDWQFEEVEIPGEFEPALIPLLDPETGVPVDEDGNPLPEGAAPIMVEGEVPRKQVVSDKPRIQLFPIENAGVDPAANWTNPVQDGRWWYMRFPMGLDDARTWLRNGAHQGLIPVSDALLIKGRVDDERQGTRRAREQGPDRYEEGKAPGELDIIWVQENFLRISGVDYHWWSIGRHGYISQVRTTRESYPHLDGERPYVFGVSQIDSHRVFPQSPVQSWQPLQLEMNDITNLRLDTLKRSIAPLTLVKRGRNVDLIALQRRGQPDAIVQLGDLDDVKFESTPGPSGQGYTESSVTNASFDELAGVFSTSSVQTSRQLNETVGGMRLMAGSANAVGEFDLRVFIETWVERVLHQVVQLERHYESDARIVQIAGRKARVMEKFGLRERFGPDFVPAFMDPVNPDFSDFERTELWLRINAGIGSSDPMQALAKFRMAAEIVAPLFPVLQQQGIVPDGEAIIEEVFGKAGFRDGRRFFKFGEQGAQQPNPELIKVIEELKLDKQRLELDAQKMRQEMQQFLLELRAEMADNEAERRLKLAIEDKKDRREIAKHVVHAAEVREGRQHDAAMAREGRDHESREAMRGKALDILREREGRQHEVAQAREGRAHEALEAEASREHDTEKARIAAAAKSEGQGRGGAGGGKGRGGGKSDRGRRSDGRQGGGRDRGADRSPDKRRQVLDLITGRGGGMVPRNPAGAGVPALAGPPAGGGAEMGGGGGTEDATLRLLKGMTEQIEMLSRSNAAVVAALEDISRRVAAR